jgi:large subunit ribosomal protein L4
MELAVYNSEGQVTSAKVTLSEEIFGIAPNDHAIYLDVKQYLANQRQGTHKSKERNELSGSTRKLHKQKGTGGSRKGDINSPTFRGGARVFGPRPRDYSFKLNKKLKTLARRSALSYKVQESKITIVEDFNFETPKTKNFVKLMSAFNLTGTKVLFVIPEVNTNLVLAGRNIPKLKITRAADLNTYDLINASQVVLLSSSLTSIEESLNK